MSTRLLGIGDAYASATLSFPPTLRSWEHWYHPRERVMTSLHGRLLGHLAEEIPRVSRIRQQLHSMPELGMEEFQTSEILAEALEIQVDRVLGTGLLARLGGSEPGVWVRAELDALPIAEGTGAPFASRNGSMHACGHDVHLAALVALIRAARRMERDLRVPLVAVFQPSEERAPSGAHALAAEPRLAATMRAVVAAHVNPDLPWGALGAEAGAVNAAADEALIVVTGVGGHAAYPHRARNPVEALAAVVTALKQVVGRVVDPTQGATLSICALSAGEAGNVIPAIATAKGTLRALSAADQRSLREEAVSVAVQVASSYGCGATVSFVKSEDPLINDERLAGGVRALAGRFGFKVAPAWRSCGGDDFIHYGRIAPIMMTFVGLKDAPGFRPAMLHTDCFLPPEEAIEAVARAQALCYFAAAEL